MCFYYIKAIIRKIITVIKIIKEYTGRSSILLYGITNTIKLITFNLNFLNHKLPLNHHVTLF